MKQTNSSLRQALEGGIDPLRPPEVRGLQAWVQQGPLPGCPGERKGELWGAGPSVCIVLSPKDKSSALQANTKFNSRWTTDEQLLAVQGGLDCGGCVMENPRNLSPPSKELGQKEGRGQGRKYF